VSAVPFSAAASSSDFFSVSFLHVCVFLMEDFLRVCAEAVRKQQFKNGRKTPKTPAGGQCR